MRLFEIVVDKIIEMPVFEMAFAKKIIENKIRGHQDPINMHLIKVLKWKDDRNEKKHLRDINGWLRLIQGLDFVKANKKLRKEHYFNLLFTEPFTSANNLETIDYYVNVRLEDYHTLPEKRTNQQVLRRLHDIHDKLAKDLSEMNFLSIEVYGVPN